MQIIPSLLVKSKAEFLKQLHGLNGSCKLVQLDVCDGKFVPNITWADPKIVKTQKQNFELHLMVAKPKIELLKWEGIKNVKRVFVPFESTTDWNEIYKISKKNKWQLGITLNPDTGTSVLKKHLKKIYAVMFMAVYPGFQGQKLIAKVLKKISKFKKLHPDIFVSIDGATNEKTLPGILKTGVDAIGPGSAIFHNERAPEENIKRMKRLIKNLTK